MKQKYIFVLYFLFFIFVSLLFFVCVFVYVCMSAQRDFDEKERLYIESRKHLAKVKQRKLLLTGHLDFIILTNEKNKGKIRK